MTEKNTDGTVGDDALSQGKGDSAAADGAAEASAAHPSIKGPQRRETVSPLTAAMPTVAAAGATSHTEEPAIAATPAPESQPRKEKKGRGGKIAAGVLGAAVLLAGGAYVGAALLTQDKLPAHLTVEGIDVSGQSLDEAKATLSAALGKKAATPVQLAVGDQKVSVKPSDAGLGVDTNATLNSLTGLSWDPRVIAGRLFGSQDRDAVTTVSPDKLETAVKAAADQLNTEPTEGSVSFEDGQVVAKAPSDGIVVDAAKTAGNLQQRWLRADGAIEAVSKTTDPKISAQEWKDFEDTTAAKLVSGPITVAAGDLKSTLSPTALGAAATVTAEGKPSLSLDGEKLVASAVKANPQLKPTGNDATVKLAGSGDDAKVEVVPATTGKGIDAKELAEQVSKASTETGRTATVALKDVQPEISTDKANAWKMTKVAEFATPYPTYDTVRTKNLRLGASRVNGTVVLPGKEFNLGNRFGPITTANGYVASGVVENGNATTALGGGISQISTMAYNAGFLGGMDILEHKPHSRWFDRYPAGRESTYWEGQVNMRWKNTTDAPVVVQMWVTDSQVKTALWGVKTWDVKTKTSDHYAITSPTTVHSNAAKCTPESGGKSGFSVNVTRDRTKVGGGQSLPHETFKWTYSPWNRIVCDKK